jgi:hypothetical protein
MCLRFIFLLIIHAASWPRLSRRQETSKTAEILILRHQLAILKRHQPRRPRLNWADRALLATLVSVIPRGRRQVCVPETSSTSCDQAVFVDHATDMSLSLDAVLVEVDRFG